ncbi:FecR family protein [Thalassoporum mexicanum PCC 7367]|uniref:FecR family protein n=1 Tax=Thalassoporum mexicanum TaxID=3457544 RepID=UPI00029FCFDC|nr:FecR family protein [Pseudanabaena sp. PCC 7367]AFY69454.1 FecR family protein [Pseudanabaena sp. PCC 7367]
MPFSFLSNHLGQQRSPRSSRSRTVNQPNQAAKRSNSLPLYFLVGILTALSGQVMLSANPVKAQTTNTRVTRARIIEILEGNQVFIQNRRARVNDVARERQQVSTRSSRAQLRFNNRAVARLGRNSSLTIGSCGAQLQRGEMLVEGPAPACTSRVTSAVRGTTYTVTIDDSGREAFRVWEGRIDVTPENSNEEAIAVRGGEAYIFDPRQGDGLVRQISHEEYEDVFSGDLVVDYLDELEDVREIRRIHQDLYPDRVFPFKGVPLRPHRGHFSLSIRQDQPTQDFVIARVSLKSRRGNGFREERYVGDYLYPINTRAGFIRGLNPDDRIAVRLFTADEDDPKLIGYSEFDLLREYAAVSIVLPEDRQPSGTVRTVYGIDADQRGAIDSGVTIYDYLTSLNYPRSGDYLDTSVTFLDVVAAQDINMRLYDPGNLPSPTRGSQYHDTHYPNSLSIGAFPLIAETMPVFSPSLLRTINALPYERMEPVAIRADDRSAYEVTQQILNYKDR